MLASCRARRRIVVGFVFALGVPAICYGQATVLILAQGNPNDPELSRVVERAADVELSKSPTVSATVAENAPAGEAGKSPALSPPVAEFLLWINYTRSDNEIRLQLSLRDARAATIVASYAATLPFDLNFDVGVSDSVRRLMDMPGVAGALKRAAESAKTAAARTAQAAPPARGGAKPGSSGQNAQGAGSSAGQAGAAASNASRAHSAGASGLTEELPATPRRWAFTFGGSGSPLLLVGNASNYYRYGAGASLHAGVQFPFDRVDFETGLVVGADVLIPVVGASAGLVYSALVGPQVKLGTPSKYPVAMGVRVSGGAAFIIANPSSLGYQAKTDLFASGAVTTHIRVSGRFVIGTQLGIIAIFEERYPIVAVEPMLTLGFSP